MRWMILFCLVAALLTSSIAAPDTECGELGDCITECKEKCGCDRSVAYYYNATSDECMLDMKALMKTIVEKYNTEENIREEAERVFRGILVAAILFITCASCCVVSACMYCFRINYTDYKLKKDVKALAKKLGRDGKLNKTVKPKPEPKAESCNVIVKDAGLYVV